MPAFDVATAAAEDIGKAFDLTIQLDTELNTPGKIAALRAKFIENLKNVLAKREAAFVANPADADALKGEQEAFSR